VKKPRTSTRHPGKETSQEADIGYPKASSMGINAPEGGQKRGRSEVPRKNWKAN